MTEQELLEKLTGVNNPRFITPSEDAIIKECLTIINNLEQQLTTHSVVERYLFEGRDLTNNQPFKKVIDAENRESAIAVMEVTYPHLKRVMTTKV